ncbi:PGPGW domain-containing protein [Marisediminicola sp. LYQ85]|uniref:PGPGW domain-containing protein n=1 Tax=Marisediminicola sp. LYQ85 TaxID=3391062 RepID=UPI0039837A8C
MRAENGPRRIIPRWVERRAIEVAGWILIVAGLAALVLPGPGLLCLVAGLAVLSLRYSWAERLLHPVRAKAFLLASEGVQSWPRIASSVAGALALVAVGIVWGVGIAVPEWWPLDDGWWLAGGWGTGVTLIASGALALGMIVYSYRRFHDHPEPAPR